MGPGAQKLWERLEPLVDSPKMGPVLWQLPPNFKRDDDRLAHALDQLPPGHHAFEFRHPSWFEDDDVLAVLREHRVALVIGDRPERPWQPHELTSDFTLIRFHCGHRGRRGNYSDDRARRVGRPDRAPARQGRRLRLLQQRLGGLRAAQRGATAAARAALKSV